jgi:hypothetical protein
VKIANEMKREAWEPDYDDEPRLPGKSALTLFMESCRAADAERERQQQNGDGNTAKFEHKRADVLVERHGGEC